MDLKRPALMYLKAVLFLVLGTLAAAALLMDFLTLRHLALLAICVWSYSRAYYFAFYVVEHYADPTFHFAGLTSFARYLWRRRRWRLKPPPR